MRFRWTTMITWVSSTFTIALLLLAGCSKTSADKLTAGANTCDTTHVGYAKDILPIVQQFCYPCHGTGNTSFGDQVSLVGYDALQGWAQAGYIVGNVTHAAGYEGMPYGKPKLDVCAINMFIAWVKQGEPQ